MSWILLSLACSGDAPALVVDDPWVRLSPPGAPNSAAFMTLTSPSDAALVSASAEISRAVELHTHLDEGGMMRMRKVEQVELPAGQPVALKSGSYHVMFLGLKANLSEGQQVPITLTLSSGEQVVVDAVVRAE